ncbi:MAG: cyclase family protein [Eubacteriales bacterium]|nr:cyclase family protein [Eubacteriales bacterium]
MDKLTGNRTFIDATLEIKSGMALDEGDPPVEMQILKSIERGDLYNLTAIEMCLHTGTHIDAPKHFFDEGKCIDEISPDFYIGRAKVFEIRGTKSIRLSDVKGLDIEKGDRILLKTDNAEIIGSGEFHKSFVFLTSDAAEYLVEKGIKTIGIDYFSVEEYGSQTFETHHTLLSNGVAIIEGLDLRKAAAGIYDLIALPLRIKGGDGSPARVLLSPVI